MAKIVGEWTLWKQAQNCFTFASFNVGPCAKGWMCNIRRRTSRRIIEKLISQMLATGTCVSISQTLSLSAFLLYFSRLLQNNWCRCWISHSSWLLVGLLTTACVIVIVIELAWAALGIDYSPKMLIRLLRAMNRRISRSDNGCHFLVLWAILQCCGDFRADLARRLMFSLLAWGLGRWDICIVLILHLCGCFEIGRGTHLLGGGLGSTCFVGSGCRDPGQHLIALYFFSLTLYLHHWRYL